MIRASLLLGAVLLLSACSSKPEGPLLEVESQQLHQRVNAKGQDEFAFVVTVKATPQMNLDTSKPVSRRDLKRFADQQRVEDSSEMKLKLEDEAVVRLKKALSDARYCESGYKIEQVFWRDRSVQLRGICQ
ncbi:hypothetical protein PRUB_a2306 [Pseudoalteromonas rubra]|uniref:Lipoprotein n=1 Tax=Pseudoalteromonas rubra TaxID=43658 RepID=A0A8T0CAW9_9GAMM|nr:hypothetical protein [Pseudoalteromonas rubra]KAF7787809.1 hypothetical protein PRUB_a2306 [Pseudoalteromonas rubra]MEC4090429.1 hypothetical protein [Pseudoalteromonas rubra]